MITNSVTSSYFKCLSAGYPQQGGKSVPNPSVPVTGVFDQGARFDPNKPVSVPVSGSVLEELLKHSISKID